MPRPDHAYVLRERKRRADKDCPECHGEGTVSYTSRNLHGYVDVPCKCLMRSGDFTEEPD